MSEFEYKNLLKRLRSDLPKAVLEHSRFTIPRVDSFIEGNRTFIRNFHEITDILARPENAVLKYIARELATAGTIEGTQAIFQGKFNRSTLNAVLERYTKLYVICPECGKPDTEIIKERRYQFLVCKACGARNSVKSY
ncbi:MAG: translation initiation factor IF-2 subunit beta [Candidatus Odinarchaeia archaeon]